MNLMTRCKPLQNSSILEWEMRVAEICSSIFNTQRTHNCEFSRTILIFHLSAIIMVILSRIRLEHMISRGILCVQCFAVCGNLPRAILCLQIFFNA